MTLPVPRRIVEKTLERSFRFQRQIPKQRSESKALTRRDSQVTRRLRHLYFAPLIFSSLKNRVSISSESAFRYSRFPEQVPVEADYTNHLIRFPPIEYPLLKR